MTAVRPRPGATKGNSSTHAEMPPDFIGVRAVQTYPKPASEPNSRSFPVGAALSFPVRSAASSAGHDLGPLSSHGPPATLTISPGARLVLSTATVEVAGASAEDSAATLYVATSECHDFLSLCEFRPGTAPTLTSLGIEASGPRMVRLAVASPRAGTSVVNVFGRVVSDGPSEGPDGAGVGGGAGTARVGAVGAAPAVGERASDAGAAGTPKSRSKKRKVGGDGVVGGGGADGGDADPKATQEDERGDAAGARRNSEAALGATSLEQAPLSRKQRKKLAKKKAKELEEAVAKEQGYHTRGGENSKGTAAADISTTASAVEGKKAASLTRERRLDGGIVIRDIIVGAGKPVRPGRKVSINYESAFPDGRVFDKNKSKSSPLSFRPGTGEVIKGLERGLEGMRVGGERVITVPPQMGYGKKGTGDVIPGNATLVFTVQLVGVGGGK